MLAYFVRRSFAAVGTLWVVSLIAFVIIQLPPGDYVTAYIAAQQASGTVVTDDEAETLRDLYGLNDHVSVQYAKWLIRVVQGDFGLSMEYRLPVTDVIGDRLWTTIAVAAMAVLFVWLVALPIGVYSAIKQYSLADYTMTFIGFLGLAVPNFLLALVLMYLGFKYLNANIGGLFSSEFVDAPWSLARFWDMMKHLWLPGIVLGTAGTAQLIRIMRANLLDELHKPYVVTARAKGMQEWKLVLKYPGASRSQSVRQHHRVHIPVHSLGEHHRLSSAKPAHGGTAAAPGAARPGYVPGRHDYFVDRRADGGRDIHLRHRAGHR